MGSCQNYGPFLGTLEWDPKRDHNFDNHPYIKQTYHAGFLGLATIYPKSQLEVQFQGLVHYVYKDPKAQAQFSQPETPKATKAQPRAPTTSKSDTQQARQPSTQTLNP